jgi:hypothetical protein
MYKTDLASTFLSKQPQPILELVDTSHGISTAVEVDQRASFTRLPLVFAALWVENAYWYGSVWATDCCKFHFAYGMLLLLRYVLETKDVEVVTTLFVKVASTSEVQVRMFLQETANR